MKPYLLRVRLIERLISREDLLKSMLDLSSLFRYFGRGGIISSDSADDDESSSVNADDSSS